MKEVTINDLMRSVTAQMLGIDNTFPAGRRVKCVASLELVVAALNKIQERFNSPLVITSGYRCEALNKAVGGVPNSQHMLGEAADFYIVGVSLPQVFYYIVNNMEFDQCILYRRKKIIHISVRPSGYMRKVSIVR